MTASQRIKKLLEGKNISKSKYGNILGMTRDAVNKMFANKSDPKLKVIVNLKNEFPNLSLDWLVLGKEPMFLAFSLYVT